MDVFEMIDSPIRGYRGALTEVSRRIVQKAGTDTCGPAVAKRLLFDIQGQRISQHVLNERMITNWRKPGYDQAKALAQAMSDVSTGPKWIHKPFTAPDEGVEFLKSLEGKEFDSFIGIIGKRGEHAVIIDRVSHSVVTLRDPADGFTRHVPVGWFHSSFFDIIRRGT